MLQAQAPAVPVVDVDPYSDEFLLNPYPFHEQLREAGPVVWIPQYQVYATARHEQVRAVLNDHDTFISSAGVGLANFRHETPFRPRSLILEADPPEHTRARAVLARILSPKTVMQIRAGFKAEAEALLDRVIGGARGNADTASGAGVGAGAGARAGDGAREIIIDAVRDIAEVFPLKVFPDAVGLGDEGRGNLLIYGNMIFNAFGPRNERLARAAAEVEPVTEWIMSHCDRSRLRPGGFGDLIYQAADAGEIPAEDAPLLVRSFLSAGVDTTVNGIANALLCLAQHPEAYEQLRAEPALARPAFEEALRFESSVQTFFRTTMRDTELAGAVLPVDSKIVTFLAAANRDPRQWPEPDRYDIRRRPAGHMAFGSGIHGCVGQVVARLEGELILTALAQRVRRIELIAKPTRRLNNTLRALGSLPLRLELA